MLLLYYIVILLIDYSHYTYYTIQYSICICAILVYALAAHDLFISKVAPHRVYLCTHVSRSQYSNVVCAALSAIDPESLISLSEAFLCCVYPTHN